MACRSVINRKFAAVTIKHFKMCRYCASREKAERIKNERLALVQRFKCQDALFRNKSVVVSEKKNALTHLIANEETFNVSNVPFVIL